MLCFTRSVRLVTWSTMFPPAGRTRDPLHCSGRLCCPRRLARGALLAAPARLRPHHPCIRRLRCGGDGGPGNSPLHRHALADVGRRQGGGGADAALPSPRAVKPAARLCPGEAPGPRARHVSWVCAVRPHCYVCISAALSWLVWCYVCCCLLWAASLCLTPVFGSTPVGHSGGRSLASLDDCNKSNQIKSGIQRHALARADVRIGLPSCCARCACLGRFPTRPFDF
jgi:hypothetical protein